MSRALITGSCGFVGRVLVDRMMASGYDVCGVDRVAQDDFPGEGVFTGDLTDGDFVDTVIEASQPDVIVHLAAYSSVRESLDAPSETVLGNTAPVLHLLGAMRASKRKMRMLAVGSSEEYGVAPPEDMPLTEDMPPAPVSPYALSKVIQNECCASYARLYGVDVVMTRSFNHTGPGQRPTFVLPSFAQQIAGIKLGRREPVMHVGNLSARREFLDVRDVCDAYMALIRDGATGDTYNVCSGVSLEVADLLDRLCRVAGVEVERRVDPERLRPVDMPELRGDPSRIASQTGWRTQIDIDETLRSLIDHWVERVGKEESQ